MSTEQPEQPSEVADATVATEKKAGFSFPFGAFKGTQDKPLGYQPVTKSDHHKTPHRPPNGTRRSMGKR